MPRSNAQLSPKPQMSEPRLSTVLCAVVERLDHHCGDDIVCLPLNAVIVQTRAHLDVVSIACCRTPTVFSVVGFIVRFILFPTVLPRFAMGTFRPRGLDEGRCGSRIFPSGSLPTNSYSYYLPTNACFLPFSMSYLVGYETNVFTRPSDRIGWQFPLYIVFASSNGNK